MAAATEIPFQHSEPADADAERDVLDAYSRSVVGVAEALSPSVANLRVTRRGRGGGQVPAGAGSGVVLTPELAADDDELVAAEACDRVTGS